MSAERDTTRTVATFAVDFTRFMNPDGSLCGPLPDFAEDLATLAGLYRDMVRLRAFDAKAVALQRTGRLGTYASSLGQEAVAVGVGAAMTAEDVLLPSFREQGAQFCHGVTMVEILRYWGGDERGSDYAGPRDDFPICVPVGTHAPHAVGVALAFKLRRQPRVAVCVLGDGATSKGDLYEAMNLAGVWRLPVVFVVNNNGWAISVPRASQTACETLAQKAIAAGFAGHQVDGNDVIAVLDGVRRAVERARAGDGPALLEALSYRLGDHTTVDDASRYRDDAEVSARWKEEPILRLRRHLTDGGHWTKADEDRLLEEAAAEVDAAAEAYLATPPRAPESIFDHLYAELPRQLAEQRSEVAEGGHD
ncbi:MAG TPA: pyruvate dehydrogenase (acetyl-transferring) E1 component subunit alpha [Kiloniellales bacterium]